jgi:hypothetical protein
VSKPTNQPFDDVIRACVAHVADGRIVYQKFDCEKCGERLGIEEPNHLYEAADCWICGHITDIRKTGCGYMLMLSSQPNPLGDAPPHLTVVTVSEEEKAKKRKANDGKTQPRPKGRVEDTPPPGACS